MAKLDHDRIEEEGLACSCSNQRPIRRLVSYGASTLSLPFCETCGLVILEVRTPDELAVIRQDVEALRRLAADLREQLAGALRGGAVRQPTGRAPLRVLPGGRAARRRG